MKNLIFGVFICSVLLAGCSAKQKIVKVEPQVQKIDQEAQGLKRKVAIARFSNETIYAKGVFYDKENDPLGKQATDILSTKLAATNKFLLLEYQDMDKIFKELELSGNDSYKRIGADYLIIGSLTEFGRKNIGDVNFGSKRKSQIVQAAVSIRLVDVMTGQIIYSEEARGEAETTTKTVLGYGEKADYDATLNDKAISAAISKLVENIVNNCMDRPWRSYFLSHDNDGIFIAGGKNQGIKSGDVYAVFERGKEVKNPQTGMMMELPGTPIGKIRVSYTGGTDPNNEFSLVSFIEGEVEAQNLNNYYIEEIKK